MNPVKIPSMVCLLVLILRPAFAAVPAGKCASSQEVRGQFGSDLIKLAQRYVRPAAEESNHYFELWAGPGVSEVTRTLGLTNNRALFINSHGKARSSGLRRHYAFYPHQSLVEKPGQPPYYSMEDIARVVGSDAALRIHNVLLAGCNEEGVLDAAEVRRFFPNATNVTHIAAGDLGYQAMFLQALTTHSSTIAPLYEVPRTNHLGRVEYFKGTSPARHATRLNPYIAELFRPGETKPFRIQRAGRELLDPSGRH